MFAPTGVVAMLCEKAWTAKRGQKRAAKENFMGSSTTFLGFSLTSRQGQSDSLTQECEIFALTTVVRPKSVDVTYFSFIRFV